MVKKVKNVYYVIVRGIYFLNLKTGVVPTNALFENIVA